ncbi:MAG: polyprenol monophosphomannose synthase [Chthoniobacterales bacterium]
MIDFRARPVSTVYTALERTLIIVPTYNEESNIGELVRQFFHSVANVNLLVVDDASPDGTAEVVDRLTQRYPSLRVLRRQDVRGLGRAYTAGILYGLENDFQIIGTMDADLSHDPAYLPRMLTLLETYDVVIGSRYIRDGGTINWQIRRVLLSWLANKYAAKLLGVPAHDITSGFRLYRRKALEWIRIEAVRSTGYSFLGELLYRAYLSGARIGECPIVFYDRTMGASKLHTREIYLGALNLLRLRLSVRKHQRCVLNAMLAGLAICYGGG